LGCSITDEIGGRWKCADGLAETSFKEVIAFLSGSCRSFFEVFKVGN
jgi:hypothetical protein